MVIDPRKTLFAVFFKTAAGNEPVRNFLRKDLSDDERKLVGADIKTVEYGWPVGMPTCQDIGNSIKEVRTDMPTRICRVLFGIEGNMMIILHAFIKKTQKTPKSDKDLAIARLKEYRKAHAK